MVLKLSGAASEALSDIILYSLQNEGLEKAENLEHFFHTAFSHICTAPEDDPYHLNDAAVFADGIHITTIQDYAIAYQAQPQQMVVLDICHRSRYANVFNP